MDQFLEQHLYADLKDQNLQAQDQQAQAPKPKTKHSKTKLPRDAGKIVRQIIFKDRLSESLFQEYQKSQISLSTSGQNLADQSSQLALQNRSKTSATTLSNISSIYGNISRDYVRSSPQNELTSNLLDKVKEKLSESFTKIYNQSISQSSSELLPEQGVLLDANSSVSIDKGAGSLELVQSENRDGPKRRSRSPGQASRRGGHPFAPASEEPIPPPRPPGIRGLDLKKVVSVDILNLSSVDCGTGTGRGSGRGNILDTPRNTSNHSSARGPGSASRSARGSGSARESDLSLGSGRGSARGPGSARRSARGPGSARISQETQTSRSAPANLETYDIQSPREFKDADEIPVEDVDQNLTYFIKNFILKTQVHDGVSKSQNQLQDSLQGLLQDPSQVDQQENTIFHELREINRARIVGLMKQKFSEFKASYQKQHHQDFPQKINQELYRKFLFETDDQGNTIQSPRSDRSNAKITVPVICKALAICLVEVSNTNEIPQSFQSTESSPQSTKSNESIISYRSDYGGNVMNEILKILNDQEGSNLESKGFENADHENSVNQGQESKINISNFSELLDKLNAIIIPIDDQDISTTLMQVTAELGFFQFRTEPDSTILSPQGLMEGSNSSDDSTSPSPENTPPGSPSKKEELLSPDTLAALRARLVSKRNQIEGDTPRESNLSRVQEVGKLDPTRFDPFNNASPSDSSGNSSGSKPKPSNANSSSSVSPAGTLVSDPNSPVIATPSNLSNSSPQDPRLLPQTLPNQYSQQEKELKNPPHNSQSPMMTNTTLTGSPTNSDLDSPQTASPQGLSPQTASPQGLSPQTASPQGLSPVATSDSPPISPASASDSEIASRSSSPASSPSAVGSGGWIVKKAQEVQSLFEYSIIHQDEQEEQNPKKNYDFFIQKSPAHESQDSNNEKTKIAILKTKFKTSNELDELPMPDGNKEKEARELVKKAIIKAIEETKKSYLNYAQNSFSQDDQIYYDYLKIAIAVGGVNNKAEEFKSALREKGIAETEIENHFNKAKLLSENFQKIAKDEFEIYTGRIGEAKSRVVGMRTKRIPLDLLKEVQQEYCQKPSASPSDPEDSPLTCDLMFQSQRSNP
jgi:hypothetical protein